MQKKPDFDGINRVMGKGRLIASSLPGSFRSMRLDDGDGDGGDRALLDFGAVDADDDKATAAGKLKKLHATVLDMAKYRPAINAELAKIAARVAEIKTQQDEENSKTAAEVSQLKEITLRLASTDPAGKSPLEKGALQSLVYGREPDDELAKLARVPSIDKSYFALVTLRDDDVKHRGGTEDLRAQLAEFRMLNDALYVINKAFALTDPGGYMASGGMKSLKLWNRYDQLAKKFQGALGEGTATAGGNWVPTILSSNLVNLIQVMMRLQGFFQVMPMPSLTYDNPVEGADNIGYYIPEAGSITESDFVTSKMTLIARKIASRTRTSRELDQDSAIAIAQEILRKLAKGLRRACEKAIVSGQRTTQFDTGDVPAASDARMAWNGVRDAFRLTGQTPTDGSSLVVEQFANLKGPMGPYGLDPSELLWLCSPWGHARLLTLKDGANNVVNLTLDKAGGDATFVKGQLGSMFNSPLVVSEFVPENMNADGVIVDSAAGNKTAVYLVNREAFRVGERLGATLDASTHLHFDTDQISFKGIVRLDFQPAFVPSATDKLVGAVGNILAAAA